MHLKTLSTTRWQFCLGLDVLIADTLLYEYQHREEVLVNKKLKKPTNFSLE